MNRWINLFIIFCAVSALLVVPASSHAAHLDVSQSIEVKGSFDQSNPIPGAIVEIYLIDGQGNEELHIQDNLDNNGLYYFEPVPGYEEYRVKIFDDWGHQSEAVINVGSGSSQLYSSSGDSKATKIVAGLGYMLGLAGLGMLISARRIKQQK
ncbi:MAG: hypothetical protein QCH31_01330 [Methanolobus sp.]|nr:hypothetical protein [Methanolobus sp.]